MNPRKKILLPILALSLALLFAACTTGTTDTPDTATLLNRMEEASENIRSLRSEMHMQQQTEIAQESETTNEAGGPMGIPTNFDMTSDIEMDMMMEPAIAHMKVTPEGGQGSIETYLTEEGLYTNQTGEWVKVTGQGAAFDPETVKESYLSEETMATLREIEEQLVVTEEPDHYRITYDGDGEGAEDLIRLQMEEQNGPEIDMTINHIKYSYTVNKESYLPETIDTDMDFEVQTEIGRILSKQKVTGTFSKINEIEEIVIPQDVLDAPEQAQ